jgi:hypothetical protein
MFHPLGEVQPLHGFVKKSGGKTRAQLIFLGLSFLSQKPHRQAT